MEKPKIQGVLTEAEKATQLDFEIAATQKLLDELDVEAASKTADFNRVFSSDDDNALAKYGEEMAALERRRLKLEAHANMLIREREKLPTSFNQ